MREINIQTMMTWRIENREREREMADLQALRLPLSDIVVDQAPDTD